MARRWRASPAAPFDEPFHARTTYGANNICLFTMKLWKTTVYFAYFWARMRFCQPSAPKHTHSGHSLLYSCMNICSFNLQFAILILLQLSNELLLFYWEYFLHHSFLLFLFRCCILINFDIQSKYGANGMCWVCSTFTVILVRIKYILKNT